MEGVCCRHSTIEVLVVASIRKQGAFSMGTFGFGLLASIDGVRYPMNMQIS